jgi:hypothetical protein
VLRTFERDGLRLSLFAHDFGGQGPAEVPDSQAPGAGSFEFSDFSLREEGEALTLTAKVRGRNLAYLYSELLLKDEDEDRYYGPVIREHVRADREKETGGVTRPDWELPVLVRMTLRPALRVLTDGTRSALCFGVPERYGAVDCRLRGLYKAAGGETTREALLVFAGDGSLRRAIVRDAWGRRSRLRPLTIKFGDRFTPLAELLTSGGAKGGWRAATALCDELVVEEGGLRLVTIDPLPGDYLVGLLAQDFEGRLSRSYVPGRIQG